MRVCDVGGDGGPLIKWSEKKMGDPRESRRVAQRERECILSL